MKLAAYLWGIIFLACFAATPLSCQYVQRSGPAWMKADTNEKLDMFGRLDSDDGFEATCALVMLFCGAGAVACFVLPNMPKDGTSS